MAKCQASINSREYAYWLAYSQIEPFGGRADDHRAGVIAAVIANAHRDKKRRSKPFNWLDFFPAYKTKQPKQSPDQLLTIVEALNQALGGLDLREKGGG